MAHIPTPPIAPRTGLWGLGFRFELIASRFYNIYESIKYVWLIGKWLAWPFYLLSAYFYSARDKSWEADSSLVNAISWIKNIIEGSAIIDILEVLWWEFRYLRADPVGWVRAKIDRVSGELRFIRQDPYGWMRSRLYLALPIFYLLLGNSGWWIYSKLNARYPEIGSFIRDTWGFIRNKVISVFYWARELDIDPGTAVIGWINRYVGWFWSFIWSPSSFIKEQLSNTSWDLRVLLSDPRLWVKEQVASILGLNTYEMDNFVVSIIKRMFSAILSNQAGLIDYIKHTACELFLRYI